MADYVIIGAGSAGCVLAERLSAESACEVTLLEAGGPDKSMNVRIPAAFTKLFKTEADWAYDTVAQKGLDGRSRYWPRGRMLGGSSSLNAQMWVRGHRDDYDGWAKSGADGWSWDEVAPWFRRAERRVGSNEGGVYGEDGPIYVEELRSPNRTTAAFLDACEEAGLDRLPELNVAEPLGFAPTPVTQHNGRRWSAADAYLRPAQRRPNLRVVTGARVRRIVIEGGRAVSVEYLDAQGAFQRAKADREVLLAAGTIGSPQLLMLSGVGDPSELERHRLDVKAALTGVGRNLQDHVLVAVIRGCPQRVTLVSAESPANLARMLLARRGMLTSNVGEAVAFVKTREDLTAADVELIFAPVPFIDHGLVQPPGHGVTLGPVLLQPESRGRITLASDQAAHSPIIDPGYLTDPDGADLRTLVAGVREAIRILDTAAMAPWLDSWIEPGSAPADDDQIAAFVRQQAETIYHPVGTCRMGDDPDDGDVVGADLRVHGIDGLRVIDASVMPRIPRGHTHASTVMIAERAADLVAGGTGHAGAGSTSGSPHQRSH